MENTTFDKFYKGFLFIVFIYLAIIVGIFYFSYSVILPVISNNV